MKPLYAQWIVYVYNQLSSFEDQKIISAGWKALRILDAWKKVLAGFSGGSIDQFYDFDPFDYGEIDFDIT